jgi:hypothetical protein
MQTIKVRAFFARGMDAGLVKVDEYFSQPDWAKVR